MKRIRVTCLGSAVLLQGVATVAQTESFHTERQTIEGGPEWSLNTLNGNIYIRRSS